MIVASLLIMFELVCKPYSLSTKTFDEFVNAHIGLHNCVDYYRRFIACPTLNNSKKIIFLEIIT